MPIDPNIALGVRPVEQPNMLGQMGQFMQLRQMQQENDTQNALRDFYAGGGNASTAEGKRQLMMRSPTAAPKILNQQSEIEARDLKTGADSLKMLKENVGIVNTPQEMASFLQNAASTPGGRMLFGVVPLDKAIASIPTDTKAFEAYKRNFGLTADKLFVDANTMANNETSRANNAATVGATYAGQRSTANTAAERLAFDKSKRNVIQGDNQFLTTGPTGDILPVTQYGKQLAAPLPAAAASSFVSSQANALAPVAVNANALNAPPVSQPGAPTVDNAAALNTPRPAARVGYQYNAQGQQVRIPQVGVPEGVRLKPDEKWNEKTQSVEQVPGSESFIKQQKLHGADLNAAKTVATTTKWGTDRIDKILSPENQSGFESNFGGYNAVVTQHLTGNAAKVKSELDSLKSDLKNKGLQMMRVGGSIGAMTEKEWPIVESMIATLTPKLDEKDARDTLLMIKGKFESLERLAADKYNEQWQNTQYHKAQSTSGPTLTGQDQQAMEWANANPKDPRAAQIKQRLGG